MVLVETITNKKKKKLMYPLHMVMQIIASLAINFEIVGITTVYEALSLSLSLYDIALTGITGLTESVLCLKFLPFYYMSNPG